MGPGVDSNSSDQDVQVESGEKVGRVKGRGAQAKMTEFYQNKKVRVRTGSALADGSIKDKGRERKQRAAEPEQATVPEEEISVNEGTEPTSDSGQPPHFAASLPTHESRVAA